MTGLSVELDAAPDQGGGSASGSRPAPSPHGGRHSRSSSICASPAAATGLWATDRCPEVTVRIEAVPDESGRECRMTVMDNDAEKVAARDHTQCRTIDRSSPSRVVG